MEGENRSHVWRVRCPVDGHEYEVEDESVKIDFCAFCEDEVDKYEIANCRPYRIMTGQESAEESDRSEESFGKPMLLMTDMKSDKKIMVDGCGVIGRNGDIEADYFSEDAYVSEYHCRVTLEDGEYKIEHLPTATNPTKINNSTLSKGVRNAIRDGDYLVIADKLFEISIRSNDALQNETLNKMELGHHAD